MRFVLALLCCVTISTAVAEETAKPKWSYSADLLRPFWDGATMEGESVLFIKDPATGVARASVLFPIESIMSAKNSVGDVTYEAGRDFVFVQGSREITLTPDSRIVSKTPQDLRRPAKTQKYELTHRDGNGEIYFGARLEYAEMQTCFTYTHATNLWKQPVPKFDPAALPRTIARLQNKQPLTIALVGDSISAGANASALADAPPYQPAYPDLLAINLHERLQTPVVMKNLSLGGMSSDWGLTQSDKIVAVQPHLVILAFGMNDSAGRPAKDFIANMEQQMTLIREKLPETEFIFVASMLGNKDWIRLKQELFYEYRDGLLKLRQPGVAVADLTSTWQGFLELKKDWDQTGNGVNHPNDFGHRVYAQVISALLIPPSK